MNEQNLFLNLLDNKAIDDLLNLFKENKKIESSAVKRKVLKKIFSDMNTNNKLVPKFRKNSFKKAIERYKDPQFKEVNGYELFILFQKDTHNEIADYIKFATALSFQADMTKENLEKFIKNYKSKEPLFKNIIEINADENFNNLDISLYNKKEGENMTASIKEISIHKDDSTEKNEEELNFLKAFKQYTINNQLCYDTKDLVNFHVSIKTNPLTIVAGMSGTGKTQLARSYGKVLGLSEEDNTLLFLPISPSYTEPEDLLGYLNATNGLYTSTETGLVDFLINAEKYPNKMHMVIFDEMNLSQVEHWFAPFLSLLELKPNERNLKLYSKNSICHNGEKYKSSIKIGNNIIFIGTVNLDETTKDFSDRLLDRANLVTLQKQRFDELKKEQDSVKNSNYTFNKLYSFEEYSSWIKNRGQTSLDFSMDERNLLDNLHELIQQFDNKKGVSFRVFEKIENYLMNIPKDSEGSYSISRKDAIDIQIKQRLLTKIKGTERQFKKLIGNEFKEDIPSNSELYKFINSKEYQDISDFNLTKKEICRKAKELELYGYTN